MIEADLIISHKIQFHDQSFSVTFKNCSFLNAIIRHNDAERLDILWFQQF